MDGVSWRQHKGKKVIYADYRGRTQQQMIAIQAEVARLLADAPAGSGFVADFRDSSVGVDFMKQAKQLNLEVYSPKSVRLGILGVDGMKKMLLTGFNKMSKHPVGVACATEQEAFDYATG